MNQSERIISPGGHVEFSIGTDFTHLVKNHLPNISAKFGWNLFSIFREDESVKLT